jgi:hypothetical protein
MILHCIYTRHHDGFVRQHHVESLMASRESWVVPFVIRLLGEYVVEIVNVIYEGLKLDDPASSVRRQYGSFVIENRDLLAQVRGRAASYWDRYYRDDYPQWRSYPGIKSIRAVQRFVDYDSYA